MYRGQRLIIAMVATLMVGFGVGIPLVRHFTQPAIDGGPARPLSYQILYRDSTSARPATSSSSWELLTVQRPFDASDLTYRSRPGHGAQPQGGSAFTKDRLYAYSGGALHAVSGRQPGPPGYDQDLLTQMPDLEARGLARPLDTSARVAGRRCLVYRFLEPPSGAIRALGGSEHDDLCLDSEGLVLTETWTLQGRVVEGRRAVEVHVGAVSPPVTPQSRTLTPAAVATAEPNPRPNTFLPTPLAPPGFTPVVPESVVEAGPQGSGSLIAAETVWAFTKGPDVITVEAGKNAPGRLPWSNEPTVTKALTLSRLGKAETAIRSDGGEIRIDLGDGQWLRIRGTVPLSGLVRYADGLSPPI